MLAMEYFSPSVASLDLLCISTVEWKDPYFPGLVKDCVTAQCVIIFLKFELCEEALLLNDDLLINYYYYRWSLKSECQQLYFTHTLSHKWRVSSMSGLIPQWLLWLCESGVQLVDYVTS